MISELLILVSELICHLKTSLISLFEAVSGDAGISADALKIGNLFLLFFYELDKFGILTFGCFFVFNSLSQLFYLDLVRMAVQVASLNFTESSLNGEILQFVVVEELAQPLDFCSLEETDEFEVIAHKYFFVAWKFSDHGPEWNECYFLMS